MNYSYLCTVDRKKWRSGALKKKIATIKSKNCAH